MVAARLSPLFTWRTKICDDEESPFSSTERLVALVLSLHMSERGDSCFPGLPRLARECNLSRRAIQRAIAGLESAGYLVVERPAKAKGRGMPNRYRAVLPASALEPLAGRVSHEHPSDPGGRTSFAGRAAVGPSKGVTGTPEVVTEDANEVAGEIGEQQGTTETGRAIARGLIEELARKRSLTRT